MTIAAETTIRERMAAAPFTIAELYAEAEAVLGDASAAQRLVNRIVQDARRQRVIYRTGKRWVWDDEPRATAPEAVELDDDESCAVAGWRAMDEADREERRFRTDVATVAVPRIERALERMGLRLEAKSEAHYHIRRGSKVLAQWWPARGKTMVGLKRGRRCPTPDDLIAWAEATL